MFQNYIRLRHLLQVYASVIHHRPMRPLLVGISQDIHYLFLLFMSVIFVFYLSSLRMFHTVKGICSVAGARFWPTETFLDPVYLVLKLETGGFKKKMLLLIVYTINIKSGPNKFYLLSVGLCHKILFMCLSVSKIMPGF